MNTLIFVAVGSASLAGSHAWAADGDVVGPARSSDPMASVMVAQADASMADGEVRKVDKEAKKITLKHGEIKNLGMPGMTMVFQVKDPALLDKVKSGDKVRFHAENVNGAIVLTRIEAAK